MNSITQESLELMKGALAQPDFRLAKSISTATGLLAFDLQAPAKNLYPFVTPLRNIVPRVGGGVGSATNWRQVNAIIGSGFDSMGAGRPTLGPDVIFDLEQNLRLCHNWGGRRGNFRSNFRWPDLRRHPGHDGFPPPAKDDAEGGDGDTRRKCLIDARHPF